VRSSNKFMRKILKNVIKKMKNYSDFYVRVWKACFEISAGQTLTYLQLARNIRFPKASMALGLALSKNPFAPIIPCHRVIRSNGEIGGYSALGGINRKLKLLKHEKKTSKMLIWIDDIPRNVTMNMALDEILFNEFNNPVLRVYYWDNSYVTIGYFQKSKDIIVPGFVRRFTGGLTVNHKSDMSYCFVVSSDFWNIYDHYRSYRNIHLTLRKVLQRFGINSVILNKKNGNINNICIQTFCENDLISYGKKIVGSCSRRRGSKLIIQGSIHINLSGINKKSFSKEFAKDIAKFIGIEVKVSNFSIDDIKYAKKIADTRYSNSEWNNKF